MPGPTNENPNDAPKLLAMSANELWKSGCGCGCGGEEVPFGRRYVAPSVKAVAERAKYLGSLIEQAKALLATAQAALAEGATTAAEIRDMQRLEAWLGRLVVEEAMHRPAKKGR